MAQERLDPLQRVFVDLEDTVNVNTHQIVVLRGHLCLLVLQEAVRRAARAVELCTTGLRADGARLRPDLWAPEDVPCRQHVFDGTVSLADASLRRELMRLSQEHPIRWRRAPPVQVFYLTDAAGARSVLMINCHHAIADARSDELLLTRVLRTYAALADGRPGHGPSAAAGVQRYVPYRVIEAAARPTLGPGGRWVAMLRGEARNLLTGGTRRRGGAPGEGGGPIDFVHRELSDEMDGLVRALARQSGHTINTVFAAALFRVVSRLEPRAGAIHISCPVSLRPLVDPRHRDSPQNLMMPCSLTLRRDYPSTGHLLAAIAGQMTEIRRGRIFTQVDRLRLRLRVPAPIRHRLTRLLGGSNACYSNPGVVGAELGPSGSGAPEVLEYAQLGCLTPPHDFILYTPEFRGRLHVGVIYRRRAWADVEAAVLDPLNAALTGMAAEVTGPGAGGLSTRDGPA